MKKNFTLFYLVDNIKPVSKIVNRNDLFPEKDVSFIEMKDLMSKVRFEVSDEIIKDLICLAEKV